MVGARLAWALLPLLALTLLRGVGDGGEPGSDAPRPGARFPRGATLLLAAVVLTHPTHAPAAIAIVAAAVAAAPGGHRAGAARSALVPAARGIALALALVAFWLVPLLWRLEESRALAWGRIAWGSLATPFGVVLLGLACVATSRRRAPERVLVHALGFAALAVLIGALVAEPLGARFLPADRIADGAWLLLLVVAGVGAGTIAGPIATRLRLARWPGVRVPAAAGALGVIVVLIAFSLPTRALTLWPRTAEWPSQAAVTRGLRLDELWRVLRAVLPGRVLFVRSGVPLVYGTAWYRPHTHLTALTPVLAGREIVGGTFTHGSPIAALVYRGDLGRAPITRLAEQLDGESLFGRPLDELDSATFDTYAAALRVSAVVALEDDVPRLRFLGDHPRMLRVPARPFIVFVFAERRPAMRRLSDDAREVSLPDGAQGWVATGVAYYPLWHAERDGRALDVRRGAYGMLEVNATSGSGVVRLDYGPGALDIGALLVSVAAAMWLAGSAAGELVARRKPQRGAHPVGGVKGPRGQA
jgi:hypothetical protein